jgi:hypothetical protein
MRDIRIPYRPMRQDTSCCYHITIMMEIIYKSVRFTLLVYSGQSSPFHCEDWTAIDANGVAVSLKGNNDLLVLSKPEMIKDFLLRNCHAHAHGDMKATSINTSSSLLDPLCHLILYPMCILLSGFICLGETVEHIYMYVFLINHYI